MFCGALSLAVPFSHACIICISLAHHWDYRDSNRDEIILFFHQELKMQHTQFFVICLYVYERTRQLGEEQQVVVVECGRASDGAVS